MVRQGDDGCRYSVGPDAYLRHFHHGVVRMTSREKVLHLEQQVRAVLDGERSDIECPFCQCLTVTVEGQMFCCVESAEIVIAILDHVEHLDRAALVDEIMDRFASMPSSRISLN